MSGSAHMLCIGASHPSRPTPCFFCWQVPSVLVPGCRSLLEGPCSTEAQGLQSRRPVMVQLLNFRGSFGTPPVCQQHIPYRGHRGHRGGRMQHAVRTCRTLPCTTRVLYRQAVVVWGAETLHISLAPCWCLAPGGGGVATQLGLPCWLPVTVRAPVVTADGFR